MFIYCITNLINNKVYIGQHNGKRETSYFGGGKLLKYAIDKYGKENFKREILVSNVRQQEEIDHLEKIYIQLFNTTDKNVGYNIQKGGRGEKHPNITEAYKAKLKKRMIGNKFMLGRKRSQESKNKQSLTQKTLLANKPKEARVKAGIKGVETRRQKYSFEEIGSKISAGKQKYKKVDWDNKQTKPVIQETKNGDFIKLWASAYQVQKEVGFSSAHISNVCNNVYGFKTHKGYCWKYATREEIQKYLVK